MLGDDRPGIVADVTSVLASLGCNLEDSTMTLLRGHFAMVVLVRSERSLDEVEASLRPLTESGDLAVDVRPIPEHGDARVPRTAYTLHVHGAAPRHRRRDDQRRRAARRQHRRSRDPSGPGHVRPRRGVPAASGGIDAVEEDLATVAQEIGVDFHVSVVDDDLL